MTTAKRIATVVAACGIAGAACAQDSVSKHKALPGDAPGAWETAETCNNFVVDLVDLTGSWGTMFKAGPLLKSHKAQANFFNNLLSAQAVSRDLRSVSGFPASSYAVWSQPGQGVHGQNNDAPGSVSPSGDNFQFAAAFAEFGGSYNGISSAVVNYKGDDPTRLYVKAVHAASNGSFDGANLSQFGFGGIDAHGNVAFRGDGAGTSGATRLTGNNLFRVSTLARTCGVLNVIDSNGGSDAGTTAHLLVNVGDTYSTPGVIPQSVAGRPLLIGTNFLQQYVYESAAGVLSFTSSHLQGAPDHRGTVGFTKRPWFNIAGSAGTVGFLVQSAATRTESLSIHNVDANGNPLLPGVVLLNPASLSGGGSITDNDDGFTITSAGEWLWGNTQSQVPFRGGTGQVALAVTGQGHRLVAAQAFDNVTGGSADTPTNAIIVARHDPSTGATQWTLAAYFDAIAAKGKVIKDGSGGTAVGRLAGLYEVTGGAPLGPSISSPAFDCAGNIYFIAAAELYGSSGSDFDVCLVRAVYDPASFKYELELVMTTGDIFVGANSATPYMITFLSIADSNSIDSSTIYSSNVMEDCWGAISPGDLDGTTDPRALGGLIVNARVTYDSNGDGNFDNATDENYRVAFFIGAGAVVEDDCYADCNGDTVINSLDFLCFLNLYVAQDPKADCNGDTVVNSLDFLCFLNAYNAGCP
ncbi:MAG TPA: GC-type dockerin domain-anchored protein [Phycisphaerales bacterium]|nr:GC-type dockerin domain-anchored protein [Phycisphaerales bacterium]